MNKPLYHQIENTNRHLLASYVYDYNSWEFNSPHFHKNYEILIVISGECEFLFGSQIYTLTAGDAIFVRPFRIHSLYVKEESVVRCMTFQEHLISVFSGALEKKRTKVPVFHPDEEVTQFVLGEMLRSFGTRFRCEKHLDLARQLSIKGCLYALCSQLLAATELVDEDEKNADEVIVDIVQYISENFRNDITLKDIARQKGYSYYYLSKLFNRSFNITFKAMLNQYRMEYAAALLLETDLSISHIAYESGFQNLRSFNLYCQEIYHVSPRELRKRERA